MEISQTGGVDDFVLIAKLFLMVVKAAKARIIEMLERYTLPKDARQVGQERKTNVETIAEMCA
ncbi:MAG: hypothetical protein IKC28_12215 [Clostridia bacterium]|nr:hypothetical protein [Clostridia bacterium]